MWRGPRAVAPDHRENRAVGVPIGDCWHMPCFQSLKNRLLDERARAIEDPERPECHGEIGDRGGRKILAEAEDEFAILHGIANRQRTLQVFSRLYEVALEPAGHAAHPLSE